MVYQVKYGPRVFLRRGGLDPNPTTYYHPGTARTAAARFERRFPQHSGKGVVQIIKHGKVVGALDAVQ